MARALVPGTTVGLLSEPSKMPGFAWGIPAGDACPWAVTGPGSVCGSCYAKKGQYLYGPVRRAQRARFEWTLAMLRSGQAQVWADTMLAAIENTKSEYFRIHDSGDFFSAAYVDAWYLVCSRSTKRFWAPTRSYRGTPAVQAALARLATLPNVTIRPSAIMVNDDAPVVATLHAGSSVNTGDHTCRARDHGNACGDCRVCWNDKTTSVSYPLH